MAISSQIYKWSAADTTGGNTPVKSEDAGKSLDIFTNDKGTKLRKPNTVPADAFMVVERVAMTPSYYVCGDNSTRHSGSINPTFRGKKIYGGVAGPRAYFQFKVNGSQYFTNPDGTPNQGLPGTASPYPPSPDIFSTIEPIPPEFDSKQSNTGAGMQDITMPYNLYVFPGQTFKGTAFFGNGLSLSGGSLGNVVSVDVDVDVEVDVDTHANKQEYDSNDTDFDTALGYSKPTLPDTVGD